MGWRLNSSLFLANIGIRADLSLEICSLCSLHQSPMVCSVVCGVLKMSGWEGPCIMTILSSAKTAIFRFGALKSSAIWSLVARPIPEDTLW